MKNFLKFLGAFIAGALAIFFTIFKAKNPPNTIGETLAENKEKEIEEIDKKIEEVKKGKIDKYDDDDEIDYWRFN